MKEMYVWGVFFAKQKHVSPILWPGRFFWCDDGKYGRKGELNEEIAVEQQLFCLFFARSYL